MYRVLGLSREECRIALGIKPNEIVILSVGTVCARKGQEDLIRSALPVVARAKEANKKIVIVLVGSNNSAYSQYINELAAQLSKVPELRIKIISETKNDAGKDLLCRYYLASDIFVLSSRSESYPRVILEAMMFSLPIVSTPDFGVVEQIKSDTNAFFYKEGSISDLTEKVSILVEDDQKRKLFSSQSRNIFEKINSFEIMISRY